MSKYIYVPVEAELFADIIRFSDGRLDPFQLANNELRNFVERTCVTNGELWGDRIYEAAEKYAPYVLEGWKKEDEDERRPLVWKDVSVPAGSEVRMAYGGKEHYAAIKRGRIVDDGKEYSPSEWASKVANGSSRNAWRDLRFKFPMSTTWVLAQRLREKAHQEAQQSGQKQLTSSDDDA